MIKTLFLFPQSEYLSTRWWHRLATVLFWFWIVAVPMKMYHSMVVEPWEICREYFLTFADPDYKNGLEERRTQADVQCTINAWDYKSMRDRHDSPRSERVGNALFAATIIYIVIVSPWVLYRVLLYIGKGSTWKTSTN